MTSGQMTAAYRMALSEWLFDRYFGIVQSGLFKGMALSRETVSGIDGDLAPRILGTYEQELHAPLADLLQREPKTVVNVGAAEGHYTVGLARLLPWSTVIAYEPDPKARGICLQTAQMNKVASGVHVRGACTTESLQKDLDDHSPALLVMDCEGAELAIMAGLRKGSMDKADFVIECHDFIEPRTTVGLKSLFQGTHYLRSVHEDEALRLLPHDLRHWSSSQKALAMCEFRACPMHWLVGQAHET